LKQYDIDNKFQYSKVVFIKSAKASGAAFTIINNPFNSYIDVAMQTLRKGKVEIRLLTITGQEIIRKSEFPGVSGKIRIDLSGKTLINGIYFLEINSNGEKYVQKVLRH
jgi:hypothetical protein